MTDEEYQALCSRLKKAREIAAQKLKDARPEPDPKLAERAKSAPIPIPKTVRTSRAGAKPKGEPEAAQEATVVESAPVAPAPPVRDEFKDIVEAPQSATSLRSEPSATPTPRRRIPKLRPEPVDLDTYFDAKYRAKSKYMVSNAHPYQNIVDAHVEPPSPTPAPRPPLIRQVAREQIQGRINNEIFSMAMRSVFPQY